MDILEVHICSEDFEEGVVRILQNQEMRELFIPETQFIENDELPRGIAVFLDRDRKPAYTVELLQEIDEGTQDPLGGLVQIQP
jgi:hypothetical protein